ncbi:MAG: V-type ATPase subunit [Nitrososphaerota archaeon]
MDPAYLLAKSFGEKGALFGGRIYEELAESSSLTELVNALRATKYSNELSRITPPITALKIEQALRRTLIETHFKYHRLMRNNKVLNTLYQRHMIRNLKTIYRGLATGKTHDELMKIIDLRAEELMGTRDTIVRAMTAKTLKEAVDELGETVFGKALLEAYSLFEQTGDPSVFELKLDKVMMEMILHAIKKSELMDRKLYREIFNPMIDSFIVTGILRLKIWGLPSNECRAIMKGIKGRLPGIVMELLYESNRIEDVLKGLELASKGILPRFSHQSDPVVLVKELEEGFYRMMISSARKVFTKTQSSKVLTVASIILKENEVSNLIAIAAGIEGGVTTKKILNKLVIP